MNYQQNKNKISLDSIQRMSEISYFFIQADRGELYVPGQSYEMNHYRIIYCQSNCGTEVIADGIHYYLTRGDILVLLPHTPHVVVNYGRNGGDSYVGYVVTVGEEYMEQLLRMTDLIHADYIGKNVLIQTRGTLWERIDSLFLVSLEEQEVKASGWEVALMGNSMMLLIQIARVATMDPTAGSRVEKRELLGSILSYVENNLGEKITLEDVANRFFVSASTVTHMFSKKMNISFYKYVTQRRLWQAKNLIKEGLPMEKIAVRVGFNDYSAFYRAFKQEFGISPRQYYKESMEETIAAEET